MKIGILLLCILLARPCVSVDATGILPDLTVSAVEHGNVTLRAVFGPGTLPSGSILLIALRKPNKEVFAVAIGRKAFLQSCHISVDPRHGAYEVHIQNVSFEIHDGAYDFGVSTSTYVSQYKQTIHLTVHQVPGDLILLPAGRFEIKANEYGQMTCQSLHRFPGCTFHWTTIKRRVAYPLLGMITSDEENCTSTAVFRVDAPDHGMKVICEMTNKNVENSPSSSGQRNVNVKAAPRVKIFPKGRIRVLNGDTIAISCIVKSYPNLTQVEWLFQDSVIFVGNASLYLQAKPAIAGAYFCRASSESGTALASTFVEVQYPPEISIILDAEVDQGENFTSVCMTLATPPTSLYLWERENDARFRAYGQHLVLQNLTPDMTDKYTCTAVNYIKAVGHSFPGVAQESFQLNVRHAAGVSVVKPQNITELAGRTVKFSCESHYAGHPPPYTRWLNSKGQILGNQTVVELKVERNDDLIRCQQINEIGESVISSPANVFVLKVQDKEAKSILGRYNYETGTIKIETMDLTFPVTAKVDVLRKNSSSWEHLSKVVDAGTDVTIRSPTTVTELRLLLCREAIRSCLRVPIFNERWDTDVDTTADKEEVDVTISVIITLALALATSVVCIALMVVVFITVWKIYQHFPRLAEITCIRRLQEHRLERQLEIEIQTPRPVVVEPPKSTDDNLVVTEYLV